MGPVPPRLLLVPDFGGWGWWVPWIWGTILSRPSTMCLCPFTIVHCNRHEMEIPT